MKGKDFGELFAGCGGDSKSIRRQGFVRREWELMKGADHHLLKLHAYKRVKRDRKARQLGAAFLGPPCGSFSRINRSLLRPRGLSGASIVRLLKMPSRAFVLVMHACDGRSI